MFRIYIIKDQIVVSRVFSLDYFLIRTMRFKFIAEIVSKYQIGPLWVCSSDSPFPTSNGSKRISIVKKTSSVVVRVAFGQHSKIRTRQEGELESMCPHWCLCCERRSFSWKYTFHYPNISGHFSSFAFMFWYEFCMQQDVCLVFFSHQITKSMQ